MKGFQEALPDATFDLLPIGDGGKGTMDTLADVLNLTKKHTQVTGPFGKPVSMAYYQKDEMAFFEMASLVGLGSIPAEKRNPLELETRGIGELILQLVDQGVKTICVGIGGSATNDGGIGMAAGLGVAFYDDQGHLLRPVGASIGRVDRIDTSAVPNALQGHRALVGMSESSLLAVRSNLYLWGQKGLNPFCFQLSTRLCRIFTI